MSKVTSLADKRASQSGASAEPMSAEEASEIFGEDAPTAKQLPQFKAADFKGALLTNDRLLLYTSKDAIKGSNGKEVIVYRRGDLVVGVFTPESVVTDDLDNLVVEGPQPAGVQ